MAKHYEKSLPSIFDDYFTTNNRIHNYETRNAKNYHVPIFKTRLGSQSIKKLGVELWSEVSIYYDQVDTFAAYKKCIILYLVQKRITHV